MVPFDSYLKRFCRAGPNNEADPQSRYTVALGCVRRIDAGAMGLIPPPKQLLIACALRTSGTTAKISFALRIWRTDIDIACLGTCEISANHASPTCCLRHTSSRLTMIYGSSASKSAGG